MRIEGPVKGDFRLARTRATIGGVEVPAGTTVMVLNGAAGRDARRFEDPDTFQYDRANARDISPSVGARTRAQGGRWPGPRPGSASSGCSTA